MDNTTRAARERLIIALKLAEEACDELTERLEEQTCEAPESVLVPPVDLVSEDCPLCELHRDAGGICYAISGWHSLVEAEVRCDMLRVVHKRRKQARAFLARLTAD